MPSPGPDEEETVLTQSYASSKRRIAALEVELAELKNDSAKKKSEMQTFSHLGRSISRLVVLFDTADNLVKESDRRELDDNEGDAEQPAPNEDQDRRFRGYKELIRQLPALGKKVNDADLDPSELCKIYSALRKGCDAARGDDTALLKKALPAWMPQLFGPIDPPLDPESKANRGLEHDDTGRLLCPCEYDWDDVGVRQKIRDGDHDFMVTASSWPLFLYANSQYDTTNVEKGLFRSKVLLKAYKAVFTSLSSAQSVRRDEVENNPPDQNNPPPRKRSRNRATRKHVAAILGMKAVTGRSIAYVATQLRFALSNLNTWSELDGDFSYCEFYNNIVDYFEVTPGPRAEAQVKALLKWWTSEVFGQRAPAARAPAHATTVNRLAEQRLAREAAGHDT